MRFRATILTAGKTATGIPVPDEVTSSLNAGKRPAAQRHDQRLHLPHDRWLRRRADP